MFRRSMHHACPNCGHEGPAPVQGPGKLLWIVLLAVVWNAWLFHKAGMEWQALAACLFALVSAWVTTKLPRWVTCSACRWKHPLNARERRERKD